MHEQSVGQNTASVRINVIFYNMNQTANMISIQIKQKF